MQHVFLFSQTIDRNQKIPALNGKQFFLVGIIAHILHELKCRLLTTLTDVGFKLKASDFNWVITVPAIWAPKGWEMMHEAGYMVSQGFGEWVIKVKLIKIRKCADPIAVVMLQKTVCTTVWDGVPRSTKQGMGDSMEIRLTCAKPNPYIIFT